MSVTYQTEQNFGTLAALLASIKANTSPKVWTNVPSDTEEADGRGYIRFLLDSAEPLPISSDGNEDPDTNAFMGFTLGSTSQNATVNYGSVFMAIKAVLESYYLGADEVRVTASPSGGGFEAIVYGQTEYKSASATAPSPFLMFDKDYYSPSAFSSSLSGSADPMIVLVASANYGHLALDRVDPAAKTITVPAFMEASIHTFGTEGVTYSLTGGEAGETIHSGEDTEFTRKSGDLRQKHVYAGMTVNVPAGSRARVLASAHPEDVPFDITVS